jgi:alpha-1,2-mannosyltransferase
MNRHVLLRVAQACLAGLGLGTLVASSAPSNAYHKDLQVEYLTASAWRDGLSIFTPLTELSARYFPVATDNFPHASPHPPVLAPLSLPLTWLPFPVTVLLWLFANVGLLTLAGRWLGLSVLASLALLAWPPLWRLVDIGQLELLILVLAMAGWRAADSDHDWRAGIWLGIAAAIKLYPALFLLPFLWRWRVRPVLAAGGMFVLSQLGGLLAVGPSEMIRYYTEVLPSVSTYYSVRGLNAAPYGALLRLFGGAIDISPLVHAQGAVVPLTVALSLFALAALVRLAPTRAPVATFVLLPTAWYYAVVLALPTVSDLLRVPSLRRATLAAALCLSVPLPLVNLLVGLGARLPVALLLALQPAGMVGLLALSLRAEREEI